MSECQYMMKALWTIVSVANGEPQRCPNGSFMVFTTVDRARKAKAMIKDATRIARVKFSGARVRRRRATKSKED